MGPLHNNCYTAMKENPITDYLIENTYTVTRGQVHFKLDTACIPLPPSNLSSHWVRLEGRL